MEVQDEQGLMPDESSCLFLSAFKLQRVTCPFRVTCIQSIGSIFEGEKVLVNRVMRGDEITLYYLISRRLYPHRYFRYHPPTHFVATNLK